MTTLVSPDLLYLAFDCYKQKAYSQAAVLFQLLLVHKPLELDYWKGLAASLQGQKDYVKATQTWMMCSTLDDKQAKFYFYKAQCLYFYSDKRNVASALQEAKKRCSPDNKMLLSQINKLETHCLGKNKKIKG